MGIAQRLLDKYWVSYYLVYVGGVALGFWLFPPWLATGRYEPLFVAAAVVGLAAGIAALVTIVMEGIGRMVLLIPGAIRRLKQEGREEGRVAGREEGLKEGIAAGRQEERQRIIDALLLAGARQTDSGVQITLTPEVIALLRGDTREEPAD